MLKENMLENISETLSLELDIRNQQNNNDFFKQLTQAN